MAPKKRSRTAADEEAVKPVTTSSRVTRSATARQGNGDVVDKVKATVTPVKKKAKTTKVKSPSPVTKQPTKEEEEGVDFGTNSKTIVIEHCKQCNQFKTRAIKVKDALENDLSGIKVLVNPEKPRRGCFEVREEGGEIFISLLDMKRPFAPMRALDMDKVISDIIDKIKSS